MTQDELIELLHKHEWRDVEFKEAQRKVPRDAYETVSAFANTEGGHLVFGVRKSGRKIDIRRAFVRSGGSDVRCSDQERNGFLIDTDLLEPGEREVRNPRIVLAFRRIGLSEHAGWDLRDVFRNWQQLGHVPPLILSDRRRRSFELVLNKEALLSERQLLFQGQIGVRLTDDEARTVAFACRRQHLTLSHVKAVTGLSGPEAVAVADRFGQAGAAGTRRRPVRPGRPPAYATCASQRRRRCGSGALHRGRGSWQLHDCGVVHGWRRSRPCATAVTAWTPAGSSTSGTFVGPVPDGGSLIIANQTGHLRVRAIGTQTDGHTVGRCGAARHEREGPEASRC